MKKIKLIITTALVLCVLCNLTYSFAAEKSKPRKTIYWYNNELPMGKEEQTQVRLMSLKYDVPEALVYAVIEQESGFDPHPDNGCGLMQIMCNYWDIPGCPDWVSDMDNPIDNITVGVLILRYLYDSLECDEWYWALNAYNGGGTEGYADSVMYKIPKWEEILAKE